MKTSPRLTFLALDVADLALSVAFYRNLIGIPRDGRWGRTAHYLDPDASIVSVTAQPRPAPPQ